MMSVTEGAAGPAVASGAGVGVGLGVGVGGAGIGVGVGTTLTGAKVGVGTGVGVGASVAGPQPLARIKSVDNTIQSIFLIENPSWFVGLEIYNQIDRFLDHGHRLCLSPTNVKKSVVTTSIVSQSGLSHHYVQVFLGGLKESAPPAPTRAARPAMMKAQVYDPVTSPM